MIIIYMKYIKQANINKSMEYMRQIHRHVDLESNLKIHRLTKRTEQQSREKNQWGKKTEKLKLSKLNNRNKAMINPIQKRKMVMEGRKGGREGCSEEGITCLVRFLENYTIVQ